MRQFFARALVAAGMVLALAASSRADDTAKIVHEGSVQKSIPVGVTVVVKKIAVGEDATVVTLVASFDSHQTNSVNLNDHNAYLDLGDGQKLSLRQPEDNRYLTIGNGQSMEGELVFPGRIPAEAKQVTLVINDNNPGNDIVAPGLSLAIPVAAK